MKICLSIKSYHSIMCTEKQEDMLTLINGRSCTVGQWKRICIKLGGKEKIPIGVNVLFKRTRSY
jgi:hypothetical protein